jgi:peroxisomal enoyl-CoA hydratase 2
MENNSKSSVLVPEKVIGFKSDWVEFTVNPNDTIIYALAIGFNEDQLNKNHFKFTYELSDDFTVFPTYASVLPIRNFVDVFTACQYIPEFNLMSLLHGEQWEEFYNPLPTSGKLKYRMEIVDIEDRGKGTVFCLQASIYSLDEKTLYASNFSNIFVKGVKGQGVKSVGPLKQAIPKLPTSQPFKEVTVKTHNNQALYYRIGGNDPNPLHVDPDMSIMGGFEKPILHGLCFYGITAKTAYELFCDGKPENLLGYKARFTSHIIPGETLSIQFWKQNDGVIVSVKTVERKLQVLLGEIKFKNAKF